ncbi:hypothetical protein KIN20_030740 [Parelaphostrongylus tenuis]|uniref:Uncharacterized protein n=1 Tax=Parelaphostrongylus tenuis TaxID=148309 RepID=A0AAD5R4B8_PARTN|nr:hypothetical protein KIN20_030740 [Parelaphostrongylus tenuis]
MRHQMEEQADVRQHCSLGLNIPSKIVNSVNQGEKFYRFGVLLKQMAHFYNTIDQQMLPCWEASTFFSTMLPVNANRFPRVYVKADQLMRAVEQVDAQIGFNFGDWLILVQLDLEPLIEENL